MKCFALFGLIFVSCAQFKNIELNLNDRKVVIQSDIKNGHKLIQSYLDEIQFFFQSENNLKFLKKLKKINISHKNCRSDQYACTFRNSYPETIFLNGNFYNLGGLERISTLIHELHHLNKETNHKSCTINGKPNECDDSLDSPYGLEMKFIEYIKTTKKFPTDEVRKLLIRIKKHMI
tara:strand:+ start:565 stop:1095 length:531 start_codon:yes stop_codon:yes gene_type:complete